MTAPDSRWTPDRYRWCGLLARAAALFAAAALLVAPLTALPGAAQARPGATQGQGAGVTIDDILDNPRQYYGQQVTTTGEVVAILGPRSFVLLTGARAPGTERRIPGVDTTTAGELPVVSAGPLVGPDGRFLTASGLINRAVRVTGTVHQFNLRAFEDRLRGDLRDSLWAGFSGRPAIIASQVEPVLPEQASDVPPGPQAQQRNLTVDEILDNPERYYGQRATVSGDIDVLGPGALQIIGGDAAAPESLLVLTRNRILTRDLTDGEDVQATGTLYRFQRDRIEQILGFTLGAGVFDFAEFEGQPVMIAESLIRLDGEGAGGTGQPGQVGQPAQAGQQGPQVARQSPRGAPTIDDILDDPRQYYDRQITIVADVGDVLGPRSFTLTYDYPVLGQEIPVVAAQQLTDPSGRPVDLNQWTTRQVRVTGTVHQFNLAAFEDRLGLDLDDSAWAEFRGRPAIIAAQVTPAPESRQSVQGGNQSGQAGRPQG